MCFISNLHYRIRIDQAYKLVLCQVIYFRNYWYVLWPSFDQISPLENFVYGKIFKFDQIKSIWEMEKKKFAIETIIAS